MEGLLSELKMNRTSHFSKETVDRGWWVLDLDNLVFGRAAALAAKLIIGKHKPQFTRGQDCGDFVIAINADKVRVTGNKFKDKTYYTHSGYPGALKERTFSERMAISPEELFRDAVLRMLPRNRLGRRLIQKLNVYSGTEHPHKAQKPKTLDPETLKNL